MHYDENRHFPIVAKWWYRQLGRVLDPWQLSDCGTLVVDFNTAEPMAACWLVHGNSKLGFIAHPVANPDLGPKAKIQSIQAAIDWCLLRAKEKDMKHLIAIVDKSALTKIFQKRQFNLHNAHDFLYYSFT